jgi:hypothetical protein
MSPTREFREHPKWAGRGVLIVIALVLSAITATDTSRGDEPIYRSLPATETARDVVALATFLLAD